MYHALMWSKNVRERPNPGLNFNPAFFFFLSKALSWVIFFKDETQCQLNKGKLNDTLITIICLSMYIFLTQGYPK